MSSDIVHKISDTNKLPLELNAWKLIGDDVIEIVILELSKGEVLHSHPNNLDVIFYVLDGDGILDVEGKCFNLSKNEAIKVNKSLLRGWQNSGDCTLKLLVVKIL